jgi:transposase-like protein
MARNQCSVGENKSETVRELPLACSNETAAVEFMERKRWGDCPACPKCGDTDVYQMMSNQGGRQANFRWRCRGCKSQYSVRTGTVMEDSAIPVRHWCYAYWAACASKKGVSALQIQRQTGLSYKSALFLMHRIRFGMVDTHGEPLRGTVEVDETYVGGKPRKANRVEDRVPAKRGRGTKKQPVVAMVERGGRVRTRVVANVTAANLREAMRDCISPSAFIVTDELSVYPSAARGFAGHRTVTHGTGAYAYTATDGFDVNTNTIESFFALVKRAVYGTYHNVSREHLHRYVTEREFVYNTRFLDDGARVAQAIRMSEGKRLTYRA